MALTVRSHLLLCEKERNDILKQCGVLSDPLFANYRYDEICLAYHIYLEKGLTLEKLTRLQKKLPIVYPWNIEYDALRINVNRRFNFFPIGIVMCNSECDVQNAFKFTQKYQIEIALRSGAHCFEPFSLTEGIIIDQSRRKKITLCEDKVSLESGVLLGPLVSELVEKKKILSVGSCANNCITGFTLGGGIGLLERKFGLTCDSLLELRILLANGKIVTATKENKYSDLFWACQGGGGGNFGIVTNFTFQLQNLNKVGFFVLRYPYEKLADVYKVYQRVAPYTIDNLYIQLETRNNKGEVRIDGTFVPISEYGAEGYEDDDMKILYYLLRDFLALGPESVIIDLVPYTEAARYFTGSGRWPIYFKAKNSFISTPLPDEAIDIIVSYLGKGSGTDTFGLMAMGGKINEVSNEETAFPYRRGTIYWLLINAKWNNPEDGPAHFEWANEFYNALVPYLPGHAYVNAPDLEIPNYLEEYYNGNLERLIEVKTKYDPKNIFHYRQSIPTA